MNNKKKPPTAEQLGEISKKALDADLVRILKKVRDKKSLTMSEISILEKLADGGDGTVERYANNYVELANALRVHRTTLSLWRRKFKNCCPNAATNGRHDISAWREFAKGKGLSGGTSEEDVAELDLLKRKDLAVKIEERELKVKAKKGEYVPIEAVQQKWILCMAEATELANRIFADELPLIIHGMSPVQIRVEMMRVIDEYCTILHTGSMAQKEAE